MNKIYFSIVFFSFLIVNGIYGQNQLQGFDPFPQLGGVNDNIYNIAFDAQNHPWVGEGFVNAVPRELAWYDGNSWSTLAAPSSIYNSFRQVEFDRNGVLWIAGGAFFGSYANGTWTVFDGNAIGVQDPLFNVTGLKIDSQNNKWFLATASQDNYLVRFDGTSFTNLNLTQLLNDSNNTYRNGIFLDTLDNIYITSGYSDSIQVYNGSSFSQFNFFGISAPPGYRLKSNSFDASNNNFWQLMINNSDSLILGRYISGNWTYTSAYLPPVGMVFTKMTIDPAGNVWISDGNVLVRFDGTSWTSWTINASSNLFDFQSDKAGDIWLTSQGTNGGNTVFRFRANNTQLIQGSVWYDANSDGIYDSLETGLPSIIVSQQPDNWNSFTSSGGNYQLAYSDSQLTYTVVCTPPMYWFQTYPLGTTTITPSGQSPYGVNFGIAPIPGVTDLRISVFAEQPRPGFSQAHHIVYYNAGTDTVSDTITYIINSHLSFDYSIPMPAVSNGDTLQWVFNNLLPLDGSNIELYLRLDTITVFGDTLFSNIYINPVSTDTFPSDNYFTLLQIARGSFDPNEKSVYPLGDISVDERLFFTIYFQNTGTDTAFQVVIRDTLDSGFELSSFHLEGFSDPMITNFSPDGILEFRFSNILLPDSNVDEPGSHGFISYSIMPKPSLALNTSIRNTAYIYFDFNIPVQTNTTESRINSTVGVTETGNKSERTFELWPNPASDKLMINVHKNNNGRISLSDISGRILLKGNFSERLFTIDCKDFSPGIYLVIVESNDSRSVERFIKQ